MKTMTKDEEAKFIAWFVSKGISLKCTVCGSAHFGGNEILAMIRLQPDGSATLPCDMANLLVLNCTNCGHAMIFDARVIR